MGGRRRVDQVWLKQQSGVVASGTEASCPGAGWNLLIAMIYLIEFCSTPAHFIGLPFSASPLRVYASKPWDIRHSTIISAFCESERSLSAKVLIRPPRSFRRPIVGFGCIDLKPRLLGNRFRSMARLART
jgi:hypothetical protein